MGLEEYFPVWNQMTSEERELLLGATVKRAAPKGTLLHSGSVDCVGLFVVRSGQLRAFILSDEGKEITIYRLFERDICLFSASCMMKNIQFDVDIEAEKDSELWVISADVYKRLMDNSLAVSNYTNQLMASRFSEVMWLVEQIMSKMSLIRDSRKREEIPIFPRQSAISCLLSTAPAAMAVIPIMALRGVRISWLMVNTQRRPRMLSSSAFSRSRVWRSSSL